MGRLLQDVRREPRPPRDEGDLYIGAEHAGHAGGIGGSEESHGFSIGKSDREDERGWTASYGEINQEPTDMDQIIEQGRL